jgi:hypothetical protein
VLNLKKVIVPYETYIMTGNVDAYSNNFKDNPKLIFKVNLEDPFFQRCEMLFVIDNETYDIFKEMVNYTIIHLRLNRKDQQP